MQLSKVIDSSARIAKSRVSIVFPRIVKHQRTGVEQRGQGDSGLKLSRHFIEKWGQERSEPVPSIRQVDLWLMEAFRAKDTDGDSTLPETIYVQKFREVKTPRGKQMTILAVYWLPEINLILKIDEKSGVVVTFLTPRR